MKATKPMMECTNPEMFSAGPDWLEPGGQRRHEALWQFALGKAEGEGGALRSHVDQCRACSRLVESFRRLDKSVREGATVFAACPSAQDLADYRSYDLRVEQREKVDDHLAVCSYCRQDLAWLARTAESKVAAMPRRRWAIFGAVAAALAVLALIPALRHPASPYADLVQMPAMDRNDLMATLDQPDKFRPVLEASLNAYEAGDYPAAMAKADDILGAFPADPSALFVKAMAEYKRGNLGQAEKLMYQSERSRPMTEYRCWAALQLALATGSRARIDRECSHLGSSPEHAPRIRQIEQTLRQRGA